MPDLRCKRCGLRLVNTEEAKAEHLAAYHSPDAASNAYNEAERRAIVQESQPKKA